MTTTTSTSNPNSTNASTQSPTQPTPPNNAVKPTPTTITESTRFDLRTVAMLVTAMLSFYLMIDKRLDATDERLNSGLHNVERQLGQDLQQMHNEFINQLHERTNKNQTAIHTLNQQIHDQLKAFIPRDELRWLIENLRASPSKTQPNP